jgi:MFS family permease
MSASWVAFYILQNGDSFSIIVGQILLGIGVGAFVGPCHAFLQHQFAPEVRYTGIASGFSIGMAIGGSTNILFMTYILQEFNFKMAPAVGIFMATCLWLLAHKKMNLKRKRRQFSV